MRKVPDVWERTLMHLMAEGHEAHLRSVEKLAGPSRSSELFQAQARIRERKKCAAPPRKEEKK